MLLLLTTICGLSWVTGLWVLERDITAEHYKCYDWLNCPLKSSFLCVFICEQRVEWWQETTERREEKNYFLKQTKRRWRLSSVSCKMKPAAGDITPPQPVLLTVYVHVCQVRSLRYLLVGFAGELQAQIRVVQQRVEQGILGKKTTKKSSLLIMTLRTTPFSLSFGISHVLFFAFF